MKLTGRAVVNVCLTVVSAVSWLTFTYVAALTVHAATTVFARILFALIHILTAALTYTITIQTFRKHVFQYRINVITQIQIHRT